jgi:CRISPR/Cas system-associated endoribonuclease Cas2
MKRAPLFSIATVALSGLLAAPGFAQNPNTQGAGPGIHDPNHPRVNEVNAREQKQQDRIANGLRNGSLTPKEAARLEKQENHIVKQEQHDMAVHHGHLTRTEQAKLNREQDRESWRIQAAEHNGAVR